MRCRRRYVTTARTSTSPCCFTSSSSVSRAMYVPDRPTPALQCTTSGPLAIASSDRTLRLNANSGYTSSGTPLSLHSRKCKCTTVLSAPLSYRASTDTNKTVHKIRNTFTNIVRYCTGTSRVRISAKVDLDDFQNLTRTSLSKDTDTVIHL